MLEWLIRLLKWLVWIITSPIRWLSGITDSNEKEIRRLQEVVDDINDLEPDFESLTDAQLRDKTTEFKSEIDEATAQTKQDYAEAVQQLDETRQKLNHADNDLQRQELDSQCQRLQSRVAELDKALKKEEKEALSDMLPEAFAAVREAAKRTIHQRHFDVQLMGGVVLHEGKIAEMKTGEGKTLVATLPLYLNSLTGRGCHLATVNDYLARRDPYWMGPVFVALGVKVASIFPQTASEYSPARLYDPDYDSGEADKRWVHFRKISRAEAYQADITYGTSSEFGFDYLRDNMVMDLKQGVQRPLNYSIVDEVDNLLIDEARTPLIISGPAEETGKTYELFARYIPRLHPEEDYTVDEKSRSVSLTDAGMTNLENMLKRDGLLKAPDLYNPSNYSLVRYLDACLKAYVLYKRDRDYVVKDNEVIIVDEFTGRLMYGRRYSEGLHQAIEAKEHVKVQRETMTFATITIQNYFRMYSKLGGMTGTAATEAEEFFKIYKLDVVAIPTNKPMVREDLPDQIFKSEEGKYQAVVKEIKKFHEEGRPVLVGTVSIEKSEKLGGMLKRQGIPHDILNAKYHEKEASIIARAGEPGAVTVATNMAGRGVDIILGGQEPQEPQQEPPKENAAEHEEWSKHHEEWRKSHEEWHKRHGSVISAGGLHIVGTERHEARRIDNQLRGRSGRQGDQGSSRFYLSLEDDIIRRFGGDRIKTFMQWAGMDDETPIENAMIMRAITDVQRRVEGYNFDIRKHLVEYDDVVNKHRDVIYTERKKILGGADLRANIISMVCEEIDAAVKTHLPDEDGTNWNMPALIGEISSILPLPPDLTADTLSKMSRREIKERLSHEANALYETHEKEMGPDNMRLLERVVMLRTTDTLWIEHLTLMEQMRQGISLEAAGQRDPLVMYKQRGYESFGNLMSTIQHDVTRAIFHVKIERQEAPKPPPSPMAKIAAPRTMSPPREKVAGSKVGRNDPCPCGSGKKFKHCCGK